MITKNFIKQCEQAEEIQKAWEPKAGDYTQLKNNRQIYLISSVEKSKDKKKVVFYTNIINGNDSWCYLEFFKDNFTYLPTQERMQEMLNSERCMNDLRFEYKIEALLYHLSEFISIKNGRYNLSKSNDSFEQLWLAFVMKEKYHKIWTGEKWVKADD